MEGGGIKMYAYLFKVYHEEDCDRVVCYRNWCFLDNLFRIDRDGMDDMRERTYDGNGGYGMATIS